LQSRRPSPSIAVHHRPSPRRPSPPSRHRAVLIPPSGLGGNKKLPPRSFSTVGIVWKSPSTPPQQSHNDHHHGSAVCSYYGVVSVDTPDRMRVTYSKGVGRECLGGVLYKSIK
jgi:hypothetical protein